MTKHTPIWTLWNGYGPHPEDGFMRCARIGPDGGGGLSSEPTSSDIRGTKADMERCVLAYNATYAAGINPEAVPVLVNLARRVAIMPTHVHSILNQVGVLEKLQNDACAALAKAKEIEP